MASMNKYAQDDAWLVQIKAENETAAYEAYKACRMACVSVLRRYGLDQDTAQDLYQEAFTIMVMKVRRGKLAPPMTSSLSTYVTGIGKRLMLKHRDRMRRDVKIDHLENLPEDGAIEVDRILTVLEQEDSARLVATMLSQLGDRCRQLLQLIFLDEQDHKEVMEQMDFPSAGALRKKKFDCLKHLRSIYAR